MRNYIRSLTTSMVAIIVLALLSACGAGGSPSPTTSGGPANSGASAPTAGGASTGIVPVTGGDNSAGGTPSAAQEGESVQGEVSQIDGKKLVIKNEGGSSVTVQLSDGTVVQKHERGATSDIQAGTSVSVIALKLNDVFQAIELQIGGDAQQLPAAAPVPLTGDQPVPGASNGSAPAGLPQPKSLHGTVEKLDGSTLTLKTDDGQSTSITLAGQTIIQKVTQGSLADVKPGTSVIAAGKRNGNTFEVAQLNLMMLMQTP